MKDATCSSRNDSIYVLVVLFNCPLIIQAIVSPRIQAIVSPRIQAIVSPRMYGLPFIVSYNISVFNPGSFTGPNTGPYMLLCLSGLASVFITK